MIFEDLKNIDNEITRIQNELKSSFVQAETLAKLAEKLDEIHLFISKLDAPNQDSFTARELAKYKNALISLFGRWQTLFVDTAVTQIAEEAQALSEKKDENVQKQLSNLEEQINTLSIQEALSIENQLMITLARRFIAKALGKLQEQGDVPNLPNEDKSDVTEHLFQIANLLYDGNVQKGLNLLHVLSENIKEGLFRHFNAVDGDFSALEGTNFSAIKLHSFKMIQALLAQIKSLVQGVEDHTYADEAVVDGLFSMSGMSDSIM